jgi:hypothetical protein
MPAPITTTSAEPLRSSLRNVVAGAVAVQQESGLPKSLIEMEVLRGRVRVRKTVKPGGLFRAARLQPDTRGVLAAANLQVF